MESAHIVRRKIEARGLGQETLHRLTVWIGLGALAAVGVLGAVAAATIPGTASAATQAPTGSDDGSGNLDPNSSGTTGGYQGGGYQGGGYFGPSSGGSGIVVSGGSR